MNVPDDWDARVYNNMNYIRDHDNASFEDSERFEDDSECSFISSEGSIIQNWRGWDNGAGSSLLNYHCTSGRYSSASNNTVVPLNRSSCTEQKAPTNPSTLLELSAKVCARSLSFEQLELHWKEINKKREEDNSDYLIPSYCIPENLILTIIQYCFPTSMDDIRLYCCLANGNGNEFSNGDTIFSCGAVKDVVQIGYLITAKISPVPQKERASLPLDKPGKEYDVAIQLDRGRIVGCKCTCGKRPPWCLHVVAVCYHRIYRSSEVEYRKPIWDSINELNHQELKKMVQFFIHMIPWEYLSTAQKLLDGLKTPNSEINKSIGVPDPTDGGHDEVPRWTFSEQDVHFKIRKLLHVFCIPSPVVYSDVRAMSSPIYSQHPIAQEWRTLRKCMRAREPEGLWNLISIVKEMFSRRDSNAMSVLRIITEECLANSQVLTWWYVTKLLHTNEWVQYCQPKNESSEKSNQINACLLMEEIVSLWKTSSLDPTLSDENKTQLFTLLQNYHRLAVKRIWKFIKDTDMDDTGQKSVQFFSGLSKKGQSEHSLTLQTAKFTMKEFPGFHPALHACWTLPILRVAQLDDVPSSSSIVTDWTVDTCIPLQFGNTSDFQTTGKNRRVPRPIGRATRRVSPDEESSESGQESEHDVVSGNDAPGGFPQEELDSVLAASYLAMEPLDMRFIKCEALYAHGYHQEAIHLAIDIARTLRLHMPGIDESSTDAQLGCTSEVDVESTMKEFKVNTERSAQTLECLEKAFTIAQILRGHNDSFLFSFILGILFAPKQPMTNKLNQFREHHIECELIDILRSIPIGDAELEKLRKACHLMCNNRDKQIPTVPHIALPHFVYKTLSYTLNTSDVDQPNNPRVRDVRCIRDITDDELCLQVALDALSSKLLVPEDEFPMLSEVIRRQKGDLCIDLLTTYKDCREKIALVIDRYLDPHYHKMYSQHVSNAAFFLKKDSHPNPETRNNIVRRPPYPLNENYFSEEDHQCLRPSKAGIKRWRLKKIEYPTEAHAQYMTELSKRIVEEAGGNQNPVVFAPLGANAAQGPHRNLRMCGILISLYGLGLHNKVSPSWRTRTYNTITSWINGQAIEVGASAIEMIREVWVGHFTASEIASLADKASSESRDPTVIKEAAALALSVLPYAEKLSSTEISKALMQCKEQDISMLESACLALKEVYVKHNLPATTMWQIAHHWEELYTDQHTKQKKQLLQQQSQGAGNNLPLHMQPPIHQFIPPPQHYNMSQPVQNMHVPHFHPNMHNMQFVNYNQNSMITNVPSGPMPLIPSFKPPGLHQSHSAPQLSSVPTQQPGEPDMRLVLALQAGIRAIESIGSNSNTEDSRTRYAVTSMHTPDIQWLFSLSLKLGPYYTTNFLECCARNLSSPFTLYSLGIESITLDKQFKLLPQLIYGQIDQSSMSKQFHQNYGQVRNAMLAHYHPLTAELFERAVEQFFVAITTKLNFSRFSSSDREDATRLLQAAYEALHCVPGAGRTIFEDLCRQAKKQKSGKREMASVINELLKRNPSFHYPTSYS